MRKVSLASPYFSESDIRSIERSIGKVLRSGWLTSGSMVEELEAKFLGLSGTKHAVALNSGTAALHAMVASLGLKSADEVVVPANTFASTVNSVLYVGARPVLADCDPDSFNVTAETIAAKIGERTKAVIVTHVGGNPCEMDEIESLCERRRVVLMEDAAHAVGSTYRGKPCGALSWAGIYSLYPTKILTSGEGGVLVTNSGPLARFAKLFRNVGRAEFGSGPIELLGYNYRMSDIHAAVGLNQFTHLRQFLEKRNALASRYGKKLKLDWLRPQKVFRHSLSSYYAYIVKLGRGSPVSRDALSKSLLEKGIQNTVMFHPVQSQPYFKKFVKGTPGLPNSIDVGDNSMVLPLHPGMTDDDVDHVVACIEAAPLRRHRR